MATESGEFFFRAPVRRSRAASLWAGAAAFAAALMFAALAGLLLAVCGADGAVVIISAFAIWCALFYLSRPLQKRYARSLDSRRPGVVLSADELSVPTSEGPALIVKVTEPFELHYGWWEYVSKSSGGPTSTTRTVLTHATLTQGGVSLFLKAEDSVREAAAARWPLAPPREADGRTRLRLWACDLVSLVESIRNLRAGS